MVKKYFGVLFTVSVVLAVILISVQTAFGMHFVPTDIGAVLGCTSFSYDEFWIYVDRDNTGDGTGNEAFLITVTDGQGTILHQIGPAQLSPSGSPYHENANPNAGYNQGATPLDNVRTYTWMSLAGNGLSQETAYTTTNPDCTAGGGSTPTSDFTFTVTNLTVDFNDTSSQNPTSWLWNFGDSNSSTQQNPTHIYQFAGTYNVCLTASNSAGTGTTTCHDVTVSGRALTTPPQAPTSSFTFTTTNLTANFTDTSSHVPNSWAWDFDDGNNSNQQNPSHTFASAGTYNVCLTASNGVGAGTPSCQDVTVSAAPQAPTSSFTFITTNLTANFTDTSTENPTGWAWDFADGNNSTAQNPSHTYAAAGTYNVCLTASNGVGAGAPSCQNVTVSAAPQAPTSSFTFTTTNLTANFTDTSTENPTGWAWDFDDGNNSNQQHPSHTYAAAGTYNVCLTASNGVGAGAPSCQNVTVSAAPQAPTSNFTFTTTNLTADFTDTSTQNPTSWAWDFGDTVGTSAAQNPSYTYAADGTYNVCLTASNGVGTGTQSCQNVTVAVGQSSGGGSQNASGPDPDRDGDGIRNSRDNCPDAYNPGQEDGWGSMLGDACDTDWYNMRGIGIAGFEQKSGDYHLHGNCIIMADGATRCPEVANFDPAAFTPDMMPVEVTTHSAGSWSVWIYFLYSSSGVDVYQVNVYTTNPPQPDTLIDDRLEIHVSGGSWQWYQRGGDKNYNGN